MPSPVRFTVWSDFLCPWCYVAAVRLDDLAAEYGDDLTIEWRAYLLQPQIVPKTLDGFRKYTKKWSHPGGPGGVESRIAFHEWGDATPPTHSVPSAVAGKVAAMFGSDAFHNFHLALMHAYFTQNRTISDVEVILDVAAECGIDRDQFLARLREHGAALQQLVVAEMHQGIELGVHGAPTVVINDVLPITGAQELDSYRAMIDRILARPL